MFHSRPVDRLTRDSRGTGSLLWIAAAVAFALSLTPWGEQLLYPFRLFTTWVHECGHAVMTLLVGGHVTAITIQPDTSGLTTSFIPAGHIRRGLVASAGYLGASIAGCLLIAATRRERWTGTIIRVLGAAMVITLMVWMRNAFGFLVVLGWAIALGALVRVGNRNVLRFVLSLLAVQVALNAVYDIRVLFLVDGPSDAASMASLFVLPASVWASLWMLVSLAMLGYTLWITREASSPRA